MVQKQSKLRVLSSAERAIENRKFVLPNTGDMVILLVFVWAMLCFFLVTVGERLLLQLARLAKNAEVQQALLEGNEAIVAVMIGGSLVVGLTVILAHRFPRAFLLLFLFGLTFAAASFKPLKDPAFIIKYLSVVFLIAYTGLAMYKNFWRMVSIPFTRILLAYVVWMAVVCLFVGGRTDDFWFLGSEASFLAGFAVIWYYEFNNRYGLETFCTVLSWAAVLITAVHMTSPFLEKDFMTSGRLTSYSARATGFSVAYAPMVTVLFWRAMAEEDKQKAIFFSLAALVGFALILWSGSRAPTAAILGGVGILWWLFRSQLMLVMLFIAVLGVAGQIILTVGSTGNLDALLARMQSSESGRSIIWEAYLLIAMDSPLYGYSPSQLKYALIGGGDGLSQFLASTGVDLKVMSVHNSYMGLMLRLGAVALVLFLTLLVSALRQARKVLFSAKVPFAEKRLYILPTALLCVIAFTGMFEDQVPGTGKGSIEALLMYVCLVICQIYGAVLINTYERSDGKIPRIETVEGMTLQTQKAARP